MSWQIVSDNKIQMTLLILKRGALSSHNSRSILYQHIVIKKNATTVTTNYIFCYHFRYSNKFCTKQLLWSCDCLREAITEAWNLCWRMGNCSSPLPSDFAYYTVFIWFCWGIIAWLCLWVFMNCSFISSVPKRKMTRSQIEQLFHEIVKIKRLLVAK